jgi:hypothetical protein
MKKLRVLDLFSGIGGFSLGLERTGGFETVAFCEINPYASKVLRKWWPSIPNFSPGIVALNSLLTRVRMSSRQDSRARISHSLALAPDLPENVRDSSGRYYEPFAWFDPKSRSWRTWQRCLVEGWEVFSGTWPRSGMMRSGIAYRRQPLVLLTKGTASGSSLPTPCATDYGTNRSLSSGAATRPSLQMMARHELWPTPMAADARGSSGVPRAGKQVQLADAVRRWPTPRASDGTHGGRVTPRKGREGGNLVEAVSAESFATPTASPWRSGKASQETHDRNSRPLSEQIGGLLNPTWVEWLMNYPPEWTALPVSATPSSRLSPSSSAARSSKRKG